MGDRMKPLLLIFTVLGLLALNSCNTFIGVGRDIKEGYQWSARKIQEGNQPPAEEYGAPVY
jgi:predicted small secreted protein